MELDTPCLSMGLDRLNSLNNPGRKTPAGKAGQRLNDLLFVADFFLDRRENWSGFFGRKKTPRPP